MRADACFKLLGKYISFTDGKEEKLGRLVQIRIDPSERMMVGIDENGFIEEYELNEITVTLNKSGQKNLTRQIVQQVNKDINSFKFDLGEYRKDEIINSLQKVENEETRNRLIQGFDTSSQSENCDGLYELICNQDLSDEEREILCGVIAYKQHDYREAYRIFSERWLKNKMDSDICRDFILVADEFDNDVLCFFLLKHFFRINNRYIDDNTGMGFLTFLRWTEELMNKTKMKKVIVGCEPTGCYWLTFQKFLQDHDVQLVTVNPFTVSRSMELDDNSPEKSDLKDPKTIALLVKDGRYSTSYLPSGVYAELREASVCRDQIMKQHVRLSNQIQGWLQKFFPEHFECYRLQSRSWKFPLSDNSAGRQHSLLSPLDCLPAKAGGAVNGGAYAAFILTVDCSGRLCYLKLV